MWWSDSLKRELTQKSDAKKAAQSQLAFFKLRQNEPEVDSPPVAKPEAIIEPKLKAAKNEDRLNQVRASHPKPNITDTLSMNDNRPLNKETLTPVDHLNTSI